MKRPERLDAIEAVLTKHGIQLTGFIARDIDAALFPSADTNEIEAAVLAMVRNNPGVQIAAVQTEIRSTLGISGADAIRTLRLCRLIELRSGGALYPVTP